VAVPSWTPITGEDIALASYAKKPMELRKGIQAEMARYPG
jgi:hypothetical protein